MVAILDFQPECFLQTFKSIGFLVQEKKRKIGFQDGDHLRFIYDLQVTPMLPTKFQVWPFDSGEKVKKSFKMAVILDFRSVQF